MEFDTMFTAILTLFALYYLGQGIYRALGYGIQAREKLWFGREDESLDMKKVSRATGLLDAGFGVLVLIAAYFFYLGHDGFGILLGGIAILIEMLIGLYISRSEKFKQ